MEKQFAKDAPMKNLFNTTSPNFLLVSDSPLTSDRQIEKIDEDVIKERFNFEYRENVIIPDSLERKTRQQKRPHDIPWEKIQERLVSPLNNQLVVCFIDESVGYGLFTTTLIKAGTIIGLYAGNLEEISGIDDYGMGIGDTSLRINAHQVGGITRFIQHMPAKPHSSAEFLNKATKEAFVEIAKNHGIYFQPQELNALNKEAVLRETKATYFSQFTTLKPEQEDILEGDPLEKILEIATANVKAFTTTYHQKPILYFQAIRDIQPQEQLGLNYGCDYWAKRGKIPHYFYQNGQIVPRNQYIDIDAKMRQFPFIERLHNAAFVGVTQDIKVLLFLQNADINNQEGDIAGFKRTPLLLAITGILVSKEDQKNTQQNEETVRLLLESNADLSIPDSKGDTPLHYALKHNLPNITNLLMNYGPPVSLLDANNRKPFDYNTKLAQTIFGPQYKQYAPDLLTTYRYSRPSLDKTNYWIERDNQEQRAGFYIDTFAPNRCFLVFFGEKQNKRAFSVMSYSSSINIETILTTYNWFDVKPKAFLCLPSQAMGIDDTLLKNLHSLLEKSHISIEASTSLAPSCNVIIVDYLLSENTISPRIRSLSDIDAQAFYGELIDYSFMPKKQAFHSLSQQSFVATAGINESIIQLNDITSNVCTQKWSSLKGQSISLKVATSQLAQEIRNHLFNSGITDIKINANTRITINSWDNRILKTVPFMEAEVDNQKILNV